jgi:hypothetical protein
MFGQRNAETNATVGTTNPIFVPRDASSAAVRPGQDYFFIQIRGAQVAFAGSIWERVRRLIVVSQVSLNHAVLGQEGVRAIQRSREVNWGRAEQLGLSTNLIDLVPAVMTHVSVSFEFVIDKENRLASLTSLINDDSFLAAVSLAPGVATAAKTVSGLAQKLVQTFIPAEERQPILQFSGDFNLATSDLRSGYYVILGTRDERNPLPNPLPELTVKDGVPLAGGAPITQLSYVVLEVQSTPARTRDLSNGAAWEAKLQEAEDEARNFSNNPMTSAEERKQGWEKCRNLIRDATALLRADLNYLRREADAIATDAYKTCSELVVPGGLQQRSGMVPAGAAGLWQPNQEEDRAFLGIDAGEDLDASLDRYADQVAASRQILRAAGVR